MRQGFIIGIYIHLGAVNLSLEDQEENWTVFQIQNVVHASSANTLGHPSRKHQDWFAENYVEIKSRRHIEMILVRYPKRLTTAIYA